MPCFILFVFLLLGDNIAIHTEQIWTMQFYFFHLGVAGNSRGTEKGPRIFIFFYLIFFKGPTLRPVSNLSRALGIKRPHGPNALKEGQGFFL
jgi:hypothetical protein